MNLTKRVDKLEDRAIELLRVRAERVAEPASLDQPADVLALLGEQVNAIRSDPTITSLEKARAVGFLASQALRAMEARDLDARLEAVERVLKLRRDDEREQSRIRRR